VVSSTHHVCGHPCCVLSTVYAPLRELIEGLPEAQQQRWERLWMVSDARLDRIHPVIYSHPVTGEKVTLDRVHLSFTSIKSLIHLTKHFTHTWYL